MLTKQTVIIDLETVKLGDVFYMSHHDAYYFVSKVNTKAITFSALTNPDTCYTYKANELTFLEKSFIPCSIVKNESIDLRPSGFLEIELDGKMDIEEIKKLLLGEK